jgi:leader peptidase (prepilin peptidase)/N-methyltransferase
MAWTAQSIEWGMAAAFVWGALWGSFINVVIHRLPLGISLVHPPSRCPRCETPIRPIDNIPILGWILRLGRCASCEASISIRYPVVEAISAMLAVAVWLRVAAEYEPGTTPDALLPILSAVLLFAFVGGLLALTFIDLEHRILPHILTRPFMAAGVVASLVLEPVTHVGWQDSAIGLCLGAGVVLAIMQAYYLVRRREGMGGGDIMLMGLLGAWLGWESLLWVLLGASVQGTLAAVVVLLLGRSDALVDPEMEEAPESVGGLSLPFGPFLALAGLEWLFFEPWIRETIYGVYGLG